MTRKVFLLKWIFVANVFSLGYRSTLLSTLVPIRYEDTIDTVHDLEKSRLSLLIPKDTSFHMLVATDSRSIVKHIYKRSTLVPFNGTIPEWAFDRQVFNLKTETMEEIQCLNIYRIRAGDGVGLAELTLDARNINEFHFGREILYTSYASYIAPKGSPMVVGHSIP